LTALVGVDRRRPCQASTPVDRRTTRVCVSPPDPPKVEELIAVMRARRRRRAWPPARADRDPVASWPAHPGSARRDDLDQRRGALLVRRGKGGRRREVGMDAWGCEEMQPWLELRLQLPVGPLFCVINDPTCGRAWWSAAPVLQGIDNAEIIQTVHARRANDPRHRIPAALSDTASPTAARRAWQRGITGRA